MLSNKYSKNGAVCNRQNVNSEGPPNNWRWLFVGWLFNSLTPCIPLVSTVGASSLKYPVSIWRGVVFIVLVVGMMAMGRVAWADLNDGLVAHYPFNGNANDSSGNENHGTVHGATLTVDRFGNANNAYTFDGLNDFIEVPNSNKLNFGSGPFSILLWAKTDYRTGGISLISKGAGFDHHHDAGWGISYASTPQSLYLLVGDGSSHIEHNTGYRSLAEWTQIGMIRKSNGDVFMIADGLKIFTGKSFLGNTTNNISITMGKNNIYSGYLQGSIDDIRIYNRALNESEVQTLYSGSKNVTLTIIKTGEGEITSMDSNINCGINCQSDYALNSNITLTATPVTGFRFTGWSHDCTGTATTITVTMDTAKTCMATFNVAPDNLDTGLVLHLEFEGNAQDSSSYGNHGIENDVEYVAGVKGEAVSFNGYGAFIKVPDTDSLDTDSVMTIATWINPIHATDPGRSSAIFASKWYSYTGTSSSEGDWLLDWYGKTDNHFGFAVANYSEIGIEKGAISVLGGTVPKENWQHVTAVFDNGHLRTYLNGDLIREETSMIQYTSKNEYDTDSIWLGQTWVGKYAYEGLLDDFRLYNRALTECEIKSLYTGKNECEPLLVKLAFFTATPSPKGIYLEWKTFSELDTAGFFVWRGQPLEAGKCTGDSSSYKHVMQLSFDKAKGNLLSETTYSRMDSRVPPGTNYCYLLEDVDFNGKSTFHWKFISSVTAK